MPTRASWSNTRIAAKRACVKVGIAGFGEKGREAKTDFIEWIALGPPLQQKRF